MSESRALDLLEFLIGFLRELGIVRTLGNEVPNGIFSLSLQHGSLSKKNRASQESWQPNLDYVLPKISHR